MKKEEQQIVEVPGFVSLPHVEREVIPPSF